MIILQHIDEVSMLIINILSMSVYSKNLFSTIDVIDGAVYGFSGYVILTTSAATSGTEGSSDTSSEKTMIEGRRLHVPLDFNAKIDLIW